MTSVQSSPGTLSFYSASLADNTSHALTPAAGELRCLLWDSIGTAPLEPSNRFSLDLTHAQLLSVDFTLYAFTIVSHDMLKSIR